MTSLPDLPRPPVEVQVIPGRTVTLERLDVARHAPGLWRAIGSDPSLWTHIPSGPFADEASFTQWLADRAPRTDLALFTVLDRTDGDAPAGVYFLLEVNPEMGTAEIGLVYGPALTRRTGGTEAFHLLAGHVLGGAGKGGLGYRRLEWRCNTDNGESVRAAERFGFVREGTLRREVVRKGRIWSTALFAILDDEWPVIDARLSAWLSPGNFSPDGRQIRRLEEC